MKPDRWEQVKHLYHSVSGRQPGERAAFLAEACADDEDLRREVQALLDQTVSTEGFVEFFGGPQPALAATLGDSTGVPLTGYRIGAYEMRGLLGRGGMGEVYRAHDSRLGRDVAIKVLPRAFTSDPDRLARLQDEARMLAALNHPHIGAIYGLEEGPAEAGPAFALVLELVEGDTLAERIAHAPVPIPDVLRIARQIAEALEAAHRKGIIHRDLKPANIKITPEGVVKVLDFGLAKIAGRDASGSNVAFSHSPTVAIGRTSAGVIFGTAAYMSPEQVRGSGSVDQRSDIWAFGWCVQ